MSIYDLDASPNHFSVAALKDGRTKLIPSRNDAKSCVLFVHGFNGDALDTWKGFDGIALQDDAFEKTDLVFFGYDGVRSNALASSSFLFDLISDLLNPGPVLPDVLPPNRAYTRCVVVAHSLGAVVSRWALLRAYHEHCPWLDNIRYVLFAPAHCGGIIVGSISELLGATKFTKFIGDAAKVRFPLLEELSQGSVILKALEDQTKAAQAQGCQALRANRVVIAEFEDVVSNLPFPGDPYPTAVRDAKHTTVCKPTDFPESIKHVTGLLR